MGQAVGLGQSLDRWLNRERCLVWAGALLMLELAGFLFVIAAAYGMIGQRQGPVTGSFVSFYAAGELAAGADPASTYDREAHREAEDAARTPGIAHPVFTYPPVFLLVCAPLARLPYVAAFIVFQAVTLAALLLALRHILDIRGWRPRAWLPLLPFLAFPALWENVAIGQNALLTASLFAWGLLLLPARPLVAGLVLGALCYKPHFGMLLPLALIAGRHWWALIGVPLSVVFWVGLSVAMFGLAPWLAYAAALPAMPSFYESGHVAFAAMVSPLGAALVLGVSPAASAAVQALSAILAAVAVGWIWNRGNPPELCAAALLAGTLLTAPLLLFYDQMMAAVAIAFLVRHARIAGWLPHERAVLGAVMVASLIAPLVAIACRLPLGPLPAMLLMGLCMRCVMRGAQPSMPAARCARSVRTPEVADQG